jgi:hypothetical protein
VTTDCDCTPEQRAHPAHAALHETLNELVADGTLEVLSVDGEVGGTIYRKRTRHDGQGETAPCVRSVRGG